MRHVYKRGHRRRDRMASLQRSIRDAESAIARLRHERRRVLERGRALAIQRDEVLARLHSVEESLRDVDGREAACLARYDDVLREREAVLERLRRTERRRYRRDRRLGLGRILKGIFG